MRFLCQLWHDGTRIDAMPAPEKQALDRANIAYDGELQRSGYLVLAQALQSPTSAVTVAVRNGKVSAVDGPFIETKEHLGGFLLIEATGIDEVVTIVAKDPMAGLSSFEIRPVIARAMSDDAYDYQNVTSRSTGGAGPYSPRPKEGNMRYLCQVWFDGTRLDR